MLKPDVIPGREPEINVGIILPEDGFSSVTLNLPETAAYTLFLKDNKKVSLPPGECSLAVRDETLFLQTINGEEPLPDRVVCKPQKITEKLSARQGIRLYPVIAGRGFHWQKHIAVCLPDQLLIKRQKDHLVIINVLPLEHYVMCVATSEMGAACPEALIESQTIAARSWMLANVEQKHRHMEMDVCNDDCCQRYQGTTYLSPQSVSGALNTSGQVLMSGSKICDARYSKSCGGFMERFDAIWHGEDLSYLKAQPDAQHPLAELEGPLNEEEHFRKWLYSTPKAYCSPHYIAEDKLQKYLGSVDEAGHYYRWHVSVPQKEMTETINRFSGIRARCIHGFKVIQRGQSGRINQLQVFFTSEDNSKGSLLITSEYDVRRNLSAAFLYSSAIIIKPKPQQQECPDSFEIDGAGWGHGVGLCQIGALGMALNKFSTKTILAHYYPGSLLQKIY